MSKQLKSIVPVQRGSGYHAEFCAAMDAARAALAKARGES